VRFQWTIALSVLFLLLLLQESTGGATSERSDDESRRIRQRRTRTGSQDGDHVNPAESGDEGTGKKDYILIAFQRGLFVRSSIRHVMWIM
jgi:hypothetical protein